MKKHIREQTYGHGRMGGRCEGDICKESNMEIHVTVYKIDSQWEFDVWLRELKLRLCNNLGG